MAAEIILRVKVDKTQYKAFQKEVAAGLPTQGTDKTTESLKKTGQAAQDATSKIQSLGEMLTKKIAWYSISMAITSVTTAFKDAFNEIKAVDTQLTNVAKVSGKSIEQLGTLADKAYSTASKYGVEASQYMEAVYEYTKAGFQENADAMGELSTKAMLVGDTTASVADKFLIAANAAWNYAENVEELSFLVDKADYINNNYATTFEKIADGFPRVASVASMAGMSAEQTMAALGTITATTQETASRAGTALRALILNILGDTTTEVEDGVTNTQEEIDSLRKVLELYASDVVEAADATGELINPMEALAALSEAYKNGDLTERALFQIETALGGKLRTNQLDALLKNFNRYDEMLSGMATSAGTADAEISTMLTSWEAKSRILSNTWTEFVSKTFSSEFFKDKIDWLTKMIERFESFGNILPTVAGAMASLFAPVVISNIQKTVADFKNMGTVIGTLIGVLPKAAEEAAELAENASEAGESATKVGSGWSALGTAISSGIAAVTLAYTIYKNHIQKIRQDSDEKIEAAIKAADTARTEYDSIADLYSAYKNAKEGTKEYTTATENLLTVLGTEQEVLDALGESLDSFTEKQLDKRVKEIESSVITAEMEVLTQADTYRNSFVNNTNGNKILEAASALEDIWVNSPDRTGGAYLTQRSRTEEERITGAVRAYKEYQDRILALQAAFNAKTVDEAKVYVDETLGIIDATTTKAAGEIFSSMSKSDMAKEQTKIKEYLDEADFVKAYIDQVEAYQVYQEKLEDLKNGGATTEEEVKEAKDALTVATNNLTKAAESAIKAQEKISDAFKEITGNATSATEALQKYQDVLDSNTAEEEADALVEAYKTGLEAYEKGMKDSPEVLALADLLFGEDVVNEIKARGGNLADELMQNENFKRIFIAGYDEEGNTVFRESIDAAKELANIINEFDTDDNNLITVGDDTAAKLYETDEGMKIIVEDWELLSDTMGINADMLRILLQMYGYLTPGMEASTAEMLAFAAATNATYESAEGIKRVDLGKVVAAAFANGATTGEVWHLVEGLQEAEKAGDIELVIDETQVLTADESTRKLIEELDKTGITRVIRIDQSDVEDAETRIANIRSELETLGQTSPKIGIQLEVSKLGLGTSGLPDLLSGLYASGTDYAKGGATLVNEEGAEIIAANGMAWIAGNGKPTITNIPRGAKVWNAKETEAIIGNSDLAGLYGGIEARASGSKVPSAIANISRTTKAGNAHLGADTSEDKNLERFKRRVELRKSELELIESSNGSLTAQISKQKGIQSVLLAEIKYLQKIGGSQTEINDLAAEWYKTQEEITDLEKQITDNKAEKAEEKEQKKLEKLQETVELRKSELTLSEASGESAKKQAKRQEKVRDAIAAEIEYLKKIGGSQIEINQLTAEWYDINKEISELLAPPDPVSEDELYGNLEMAINQRITELNEKRDEELEKIDKKIARLKEEKELQEETNELKEKELAVEEAKEALENAKQQRTVRVFNAAKGRWEWVANAETVQTARDAYNDAKQALKDYRSDAAYNAKISALEAKQDRITEKYLKQTEQWQKVLDAMEEPIKSIKASLNDISRNARDEMIPTIKRINSALKSMGKSGIVYDSGGVLSGIGGIKATASDEMILPPEITSRMLSPIGTNMFKQRMSELQYLYGTNGSLAGYANNSIGSLHNGDTYTFGNITLSREQARSTTVYELAKMARGLRSYSSAM